ncbi:MAG: ferrous iron transport protein A [Deltaproteobacteria bacterium]|jgi:Fe2+ transport system protein FeoA|nr:ferrous iron transport protein A [Deltaproteobacteria bacterium]
MDRKKNDEIPLPFAPFGKDVEVVHIKGGEGMRRRLMDMAIYPGARVKLLSSFGRGRIVVQVGEARFALGRGIAYRIIVRDNGK